MNEWMDGWTDGRMDGRYRVTDARYPANHQFTDYSLQSVLKSVSGAKSKKCEVSFNIESVNKIIHQISRLDSIYNHLIHSREKLSF